MNRPGEMDQELAGFLEDGPVGAPEHVIDAVVAHAAAHPRRRVRLPGPDPLGPPWPARAATPLLAALLASVTLLVAFIAGGSSPDLTVVLPEPSSPSPVPSVEPSVLGTSSASPPTSAEASASVSQSPPPSAAPSAPPSVTPVGSVAPQGTPRLVSWDTVDEHGVRSTMYFDDRSGLLWDVTGWPVDELPPRREPIEVVNVIQGGRPTPGVIAVMWLAPSCREDYTLTIHEGVSRLVLTVPDCGSPNMADRRMVLLLEGDQMAADIAVELVMVPPD